MAIIGFIFSIITVLYFSFLYIAFVLFEHKIKGTIEYIPALVFGLLLAYLWFLLFKYSPFTISITG